MSFRQTVGRIKRQYAQANDWFFSTWNPTEVTDPPRFHCFFLPWVGHETLLNPVFHAEYEHKKPWSRFVRAVAQKWLSAPDDFRA